MSLDHKVTIKHIPQDFPDSMIWDKARIAKCCLNCKNHPINGGGDTCYCDLPLKDNTVKAEVYGVEYIIC